MKNYLQKALPAICLCALLFNIVFGAGRRLPADTLRVAFLTGEIRIHLKCSSYFTVYDVASGRSTRFEPEVNFVLTPRGEDIVIGDRKQAGGEIRISSRDRREFLRINGRRYRGSIIILNDGETLTAINEVNIEDYLKGVLPMEISPRWPMEAVKAQAIAARTYAVNNLGKYGSRGYDLTADIYSQVYAGMEVEDPRSNRAVDETKGKVIIYNNKLARTYFHSSCGGHTEDVQKVWGSDIPYLKGVYCPFCSDSPRARWELDLSPSDIAGSLSGIPAGEIKSIELVSRTRSGRVDVMKVSHGGGELEITGHAFRMTAGPNILQSAMFTIGLAEEPYRFYGRGWGHGVGMCQWGARGQALEGRNFREILSYYMPGTEVRRWSY